MSQDAGRTGTDLQGASAARAAKAHVRQLVAGDSRVNGVGLSRASGRWSVKVNVVDDADHPDLPTAVDGVPVRVTAVGRISARAS
ncbi:hypothetical protein [Kineococcus rubinsiae]|uniref:hypothetical protein n=1 Tax=Kineococcus rubinsiae TaxID=2609562 RepID=UPI00143044D4|nr:hypothetical protein [Kineococcus rubinsiae]NIZ93337.1 hypothetical protein [Kineococcus rubinsiae]